MNIALCGMMGVGKTSVGIEVARMLNRQWYDTDMIITDRYGKISDLFEYYGEEHFRRLETQVTNELCAMDNLVISTGGGLVLRLENSVALRNKGVIVFLRARAETLMERVTANESRPLLRENMEERIRELVKKRYPVYEGTADVIVDTDGKSVKEVAEELVAKVKAYRPSRRKVL